ncbi:MAG: glycine cleavage T C-terminal barrel domain-containing protein, partial [Candidatus Zixiibacteriota bacterium]
ALEAGLFWIVKPDKGDFIGRQALLDQKELGVPRKLVCIEFSERCVPRPGYSLLDESGSELGAVTSGAFSPTLKKPIAMGYVPTGRSKVGMPVSVRIRERLFAGQIVKAPFYRRES